VALLEQHIAGPQEQPAVPAAALPAVVETDEAAARRSLRDQIAKLERDLAGAFLAAYPRAQADWSVPGRGGPRLLGLGELERLRDDLADRLRGARAAIAERADFEERNRVLLERMRLEPGRHKFVRVAAVDVGEYGCGTYSVRPRLGVIGMLMGWWQVKLSSGCPLAREPGRHARGSAPPAPPTISDRWVAAAASAYPRRRPSGALPRPRRDRHRRPAAARGVRKRRRRPGVGSRSWSCACCLRSCWACSAS
jgi:hypothetical protein